MLRRQNVSRLRARDFDRTIRRSVASDVDPTVKRRRADLEPTVKRAIDVEKAFAVEEPTKRVVLPPVQVEASGDAPEYDVDLSDL